MPDIYIYNISTSQETQITSSGSAFYPVIYRNRIVWNDLRNGTSAIYMYNLSTSKEAGITKTSGAGSYLKMYGDRIVWADTKDGDFDIYMFDFSTFRESQITTDKFYKQYPAIYGDKIVWMDKRSGNWDIFMYDLSTSREIQIATEKSDKQYPAIYGDKIVWQDSRNGLWDIYMATLSYFPIAAFSTSPTFGNAPLKVSFIDQSIGFPTSWKWIFGDGTNSPEQNPEHKYSKAGNYTVNLTVSNAAGVDTKSSEINVQSTPNTIPCGFNFLILGMLVLYLWKKSN
jgi:beta propeller repeat protein